MAKKQQQIKRPNTLLSSQTTLLLVSPALGQPCQLNTDPAEESSPGFGHLLVVTAPVWHYLRATLPARSPLPKRRGSQRITGSRGRCGRRRGPRCRRQRPAPPAPS